jgi:hypothetical protein
MEDGIDYSQWLPRNSPVLTKARSKRRDVHLERSDRGSHQLRAYGHPLEFYAYHPNHLSKITPEQHDAGVRFGQAFHDGCLRSRHAQWKYSPATGQRLEPEALHWAGQGFRKACDAVRGKAEWWITFKVCCLGEYAGKGNMARLISGLDDLDRHYRLGK